MRRALHAAILIAAACAFVLTHGCSRSGSGPQSTTHTISFWHFWSEPRQESALNAVVDEYQRSHPGTVVHLTALSWSDGKTKLFAAFNSGLAPDVVELGSDWIAQFSSSGVLTDLTDSVAVDTARYRAETTAPGRWNGRLFALPWVVDTRVLFYNKALVAQAGLDSSAPPATWPALQSACERISALGGGAFGFGANAADAHRLYKKVLPFFWANGGDVLTPDGRQCVINSPANKSALAAYVRLTQSGMLETQKQLDAQFARGAIGFWFSGGWLIEKIRAEHPELRFGVAMMPRPAERTGTPASFAGGEYLAVTSAATDRAAAVSFARYLVDGMNARAFCSHVADAGYPADTAAAHDPAFTRDPMRSVFITQLAAARFTPVHPQWLDIEKILEDRVVEAMYGRTTVEQALDDAKAEIDDVLARP